MFYIVQNSNAAPTRPGRDDPPTVRDDPGCKIYNNSLFVKYKNLPIREVNRISLNFELELEFDYVKLN